MKILILFSYLLLLSTSITINNESLAHSGGTNAYGCHNNHKTGGYHCHGTYKSRSINQRKIPQRRTKPITRPITITPSKKENTIQNWAVKSTKGGYLLTSTIIDSGIQVNCKKEVAVFHNQLPKEEKYIQLSIDDGVGYLFLSTYQQLGSGYLIPLQDYSQIDNLLSDMRKGYRAKIIWSSTIGETTFYINLIGFTKGYNELMSSCI